MQNENTFRRVIIKNSYLPVIAAWLITLSFIIDNYWSGNSSVAAVQRNVSGYLHKQENDFDQLTHDTAITSKVISGKYDEPFLKRLTKKKYFIYAYSIEGNGQYNILFWNTQTVLPAEYILQTNEKSGFIALQNGFYVWRKTMINNSLLLALIPVKWNYNVTNEYLQNNFATGDQVEANYDISVVPTNTPVSSIDGNILFHLVKKTRTAIPQNNNVAVWLRIIGAIFILLFIHFIAVFFVVHGRFLKGVSFLFISILLLRVLSYYFPIPLNFRQFELFDPAIYGSNVILRSLGDLLINALLFVWFVLFLRQYYLERNIIIHLKNNRVKVLLVVFVVSVLLASTFTCGHIVSKLIADSQISFDVINFFTLNIYSVIGFIVLCCIAIGFFFLSQLMLLFLEPVIAKRQIFLYLSVTIGGLLFLTLHLGNPSVEFELCLLLWLLFYLFLLNQRYFKLSVVKNTSSRLVFWLFFFSVSITMVIVIENNKKEMRNRVHYAETLASKADPSSETLMNILLTDFRNDFLATSFHRFEKDSSNHFLKDSLINGNIAGYTNRYDTKVFTFDAAEKPLFNQDSASYNTLNAILNSQAKPTSITDLFYYDQSFDRFSYICKRSITDTGGRIMGYAFIIASRKTAKTDAPYPELFSKGQVNSIENSSMYAFAVYNKLQLVNSHNDYSFATRLSLADVPHEDYITLRKNGYDELWYKAAADKVVIIAKEDNFSIESITLFSYLFCAFLIIAALFWPLDIFIRTKLDKNKLRARWQLNIRNQVHGIIILVSVVSFLVIGVATILFFIQRYQNNNREKLSRTIHVMENEVRNSFTEIAIFDDVMNAYDSAYRQKLVRTINKISEIHAADINLYDPSGNLQSSSLPLPYEKGIVSTKMDPVAFYHLNKLKEVQFFKEEKIGNLSFVSNYVPVIDETGREYAYLNIPYFTSQSQLKQEISYFLVTIINLNAFIFLIAGIVALFITNRITNSFSFISNKMKEVNLGKMNEPIEWKRNDEIGELVKEYNKMVGKLDTSAAALAKSEREGAWREMARQVAHEIKNPLTPMKLSLQYLQKSIDENLPNVKELTANVAKTLVEQIDHLSQIAGEFSQFANITDAHNEIFDLNESLRAVIQLHSSEDKLQLKWKPLAQRVMVYADRTHINRLFTNLILNAIQAIPEDRIPVIEIGEELKADKVMIKITDNGTGIFEEMQSKIFTPNFTTKTSGTGLGLAMSKGIVEQAKGTIWFKTTPGDGTTFFVELPVIS